ncbi:MAG: class I SAM-dependent methyltransferase [Acidobacteriota bacterium]
MAGDLQSTFGGIDIYLFDQLLKGRITPEHRIIDAGCGGGRNLVYLLQAGFDVRGFDVDAEAVAGAHRLAAALAPQIPADHFRVGPLAQPPFPPASADVVISSAVLHFAHDDADFEAMLGGTWSLLAPGGLFFCRLASTIGIEKFVPGVEAGRRWTLLPDGSHRYLVDEAMLMARTQSLGGRLLDPLKTTVVQGQRAMTTWVVRKDEPRAR